MANLGKNRAVLGAVAVIAVIVGMLFLGGTTGGNQSPAPEATGGSDGNQAGQFVVRDYADFGQGTGVDAPSSDWLGPLAGMAVKLAFVIVLIYLVIRILKRYVYRGAPATSARKPVSVLSSVSLAPNRMVYVLEVAGKLLVVGATSSQMSLLTEVTDPQSVEEVRLLSAENPPADQFGAILNAFGRRLGDPEPAGLSGAMVGSLQSMVRDGRDFVKTRLAGTGERPNQG
ncbi:MAG: flagellar biosynthetic protein FliO [Dehalococcoidia bacterium]|nr:flagellar biosynthetic protein FliO [Dehalococcoidia bacterium]